MGCSESLNSEVRLIVNLNTPIFKTNRIDHSAPANTSLKDFCAQIIPSNISADYRDSCKNYKVVIKEKNYSINENLSLYDLTLKENDEITIKASITEQKKVEITMKIFYPQPKEVTLNIRKDTLIRDLLEEHPQFRFIRSDIQLDFDEKIENYDIGNKIKLIVLVGDNNCEDIQKWKIKKTGLILEATCMNKNCVAYKQRICLSLGLGTFDIVNEMSGDNERYCICCKEVLGKAVKFGYCHCEIRGNETGNNGSMLEMVERTKDYIEGVLPLNAENYLVTLTELFKSNH
ncbi:hypothetical protein SteCoe_32260 [Stentor coeruleus]|uniref:Ubiquitin-like domain-containing protein n=1 Tax=Stentor coeruleus TaxID=5963 RepID=A0A1R2AZT9_9CILI|nr:hypothetical protein SteCoe_32260 [Stentor coeruleus]